MGVGDGQVLGTTKIVDHGQPELRFNLVIMSDGYRLNEIAQFEVDARRFVDHLFALRPFDELQCAFNVYRVNVASTDSGADDPVACGGTGAVPATYFDASFCHGGIRRLLQVNRQAARDVAGVQVPQWHQVLVIVNSPVWGGSGGSIGVTSTAAGWEDIAVHEMGHAVFGLADEYECWAGCGIDTDRDHYSGGEPAECNVTTDGNRATNKWRDLVAASTPMPTSANADCTVCDPQPAPVAAGTVGAFEGARYFHCGAYRPEFDCMMRNLAPFCAVCRRQISQKLSPYLSSCYAPVFEASSGFACLFIIIACALAIAILSLLAWIPGVPCLIRKLVFRIHNCCKGNRDRCVAL